MPSGVVLGWKKLFMGMEQADYTLRVTDRLRRKFSTKKIAGA